MIYTDIIQPGRVEKPWVGDPGNLRRYVSTVDKGFDTRWRRHPTPQATTREILTLKTAWTAPDLRGKRVFDAGCGVGRFTEIAGRWGAYTLGADGSEHGVLHAAKRCPDLPFVQADLLDLPFRDNVFDLSFSIGVLHHTADPQKAFDEVMRVTRVGGEVAVWLYLKPGYDAQGKIVDADVAAASDFFHAVTRACPPEKLYEACRVHAPKTRDAYKGHFGPLQQVLRASNSADDEECISDTFDWHVPQHRSGHTNDEVAGWFRRWGEVNRIGAFPVSVRGVKLRECPA